MLPSQNALPSRSLFVGTVGCHPTSKVSGDPLLHSSIHLRVPCLLLWVCSILIQVFFSKIKDNWGELGARAKLSFPDSLAWFWKLNLLRMDFIGSFGKKPPAFPEAKLFPLLAELILQPSKLPFAKTQSLIEYMMIFKTFILQNKAG